MKIAIVGGSPTAFQAPFDDLEWDVWVCGNQLDQYQGKRVSLAWEIHDTLNEHPKEYPQWLINQGIPLMVGEMFPIKGPLVFPFAKARELMQGDFLTSTPAYMMAYAILQGATHIRIYGVDMAVDSPEYFYQQPVMREWIGFARGRGIDVWMPPGCPLGEPHYIEGREDGKPKGNPPFTEHDFLSVAKLHADKIAEAEHEITLLTEKITMHQACLQVYKRLANVARAVTGGQVIGSLTQTLKLL